MMTVCVRAGIKFVPTCLRARTHTHTLDAPVCSKSQTFECESAAKNRNVRAAALVRAPNCQELMLAGRVGAGTQPAAAAERAPCPAPCSALPAAVMPWLSPADVCVLCAFVTGQKKTQNKTQRFKFVSVYFCFFVYPRVNEKQYHSNSTFGNVAASQKMSEVLRSASPPRTATSSACSFGNFYPISKQMKTRKVIAVSRCHICMYVCMYVYVFLYADGM